ncbi:hypothetical protein BKA62DRAFT_708531 [Auriculariales sp. MPI-PUGE-AT-0066]|nr:hypothetical protein BKA62DRAFT_708531 [Auriculariales sp. MPI-PUGE-AT-0066]
MSNAFNEWIARAENEKRVAAVQAQYGLDAPQLPSGRQAAASSTQLKFLDFIAQQDPRLMNVRPSCSPSGWGGGPSLLTQALKAHDAGQKSAPTLAPTAPRISQQQQQRPKQ